MHKASVIGVGAVLISLFVLLVFYTFTDPPPVKPAPPTKETKTTVTASYKRRVAFITTVDSDAFEPLKVLGNIDNTSLL